MKVAFIGLGKLGLPVATAMASKGHTVFGFDIIDPERYLTGSLPHEPGLQSLMAEQVKAGRLILTKDERLAVREGEIVFIAVQTPHRPGLDGTTTDKTRADFDYHALTEALIQVVGHALDTAGCTGGRVKRVVVVSTVLPGTTRNVLVPALDKQFPEDDEGDGGWRRYVDLYYSPSFIAMGTTIHDFLSPEFALVGTAHGAETHGETCFLAEFYRTLHSAPNLVLTWEEAEAVKCFYNVFIGQKIIFANTVMQMCEQLGAQKQACVDSRKVLDALSHATTRLISAKYLKQGMGDAGACHPRDALALAWLSQSLGLDYNLFGHVMQVREDQARWLADLLAHEAEKISAHNVVILGKAYKPGTNLTDGSASILVANLLKETHPELCVYFYDPVVLGMSMELWEPGLSPEHRKVTDHSSLLGSPAVYLFATPHSEFTGRSNQWWMTLPSLDREVPATLVDPWGVLPAAAPPYSGLRLVQPGVWTLEAGNLRNRLINPVPVRVKGE